MSNENLSEDILGGIYEKVNYLDMESSRMSIDVAEIKKELNEFKNQNAVSLMGNKHKLERIDQTLKTKSDESTKSLIDVIELILIRVDALEKKSVDISYEVKRPFYRFIPFLLLAILIVLLIK